jgi:ABC-2 type transport system ATP-binding protein
MTAAADPAVELRGVQKAFGERRALDGLDLTVPQGSVYGFLGPNGAGKTTTLRILAGLARPTAGTIRVLGHDLAADPGLIRPLVGYLPDVPGFPGWMTARRFLRYTGELFSLPRDVLEPRIEALLELAGLESERARVGAYSRGMKQRLGVAQALIGAPRLLMLDEPTSALDPLGRRDVLEMVAGLRGRTTVFFSTHILADVERVCDTVAILDRGRVALQGPIDELRARPRERHRVRMEVDDPQRLADALQTCSWVEAIDPADRGALAVATRTLPLAQRELPVIVARLGLQLRRMETEEAALEDVFVDLVGERRAGTAAADSAAVTEAEVSGTAGAHVPGTTDGTGSAS